MRYSKYSGNATSYCVTWNSNVPSILNTFCHSHTFFPLLSSSRSASSTPQRGCWPGVTASKIGNWTSLCSHPCRPASLLLTCAMKAQTSVRCTNIHTCVDLYLCEDVVSFYLRLDIQGIRDSQVMCQCVSLPYMAFTWYITDFSLRSSICKFIRIHKLHWASIHFCCSLISYFWEYYPADPSAGLTC